MWKRWYVGLVLALLMAGPADALDTVYLKGDQNYPMIKNTGSIYNDGSVGRFLDLSSVIVEGVFSDGLSVKADVKDLDEEGVEKEETIHLRLADDGRSWAEEKDGFREITDTPGDAMGHAAALIRQDMGTKSKRATYLSQLIKASAHKREETVVPKKLINPVPGKGSSSEKHDAAKRLEEVEEDIPSSEESIQEESTAVETPAVKAKGQVLTAEEAKQQEIEKEGEKRDRRLKRAARLSPSGKAIDMPPTKQADTASKKDDEVKVEIVSHPVVEIVSYADPQVDVTKEK